MTTDQATSAPISYRPDLPDWGAYLKWPCNDGAWIHPEDIEIARSLIPSPRVFRRTRWDGRYYHLHYGSHRLRVGPSMWIQVPPVDLEVGQQIELLYRFGQNDPGIYRIADIFFSAKQNRIDFYLLQNESLRIARRFSREDLRPLEVKYQLRVGFYTHAPPTPHPPADV